MIALLVSLTVITLGVCFKEIWKNLKRYNMNIIEISNIS